MIQHAETQKSNYQNCMKKCDHHLFEFKQTATCYCEREVNVEDFLKTKLSPTAHSPHCERKYYSLFILIMHNLCVNVINIKKIK